MNEENGIFKLIDFGKSIQHHFLKKCHCGCIMLLMSFLFICSPFVIGSARATSVSAENLPDLTELSIEDLMNIEVVSVSKKAQKLSDSAAAIFVITQEDIRTSGVNNIPDALRMVPGIQVARIDANKWAISSRGFGSRFTNKLLVMMDGRTIYTPLYSGVFWDTQDTVLEDIDRIEVIRGPGAAMWGANAVNGVINIITKKASETQGTLITAGVGSEERIFSTVRYGGKMKNNGHYRLYGKYLNRDNSPERDGTEGSDEWDVLRAGMRLDWNDSFTIIGDIFEGDAGGRINSVTFTPPYSQIIQDDIETGGGNILLRWDKLISDSSDFSAQFYYDHLEYKFSLLGTKVDTFDLDIQHRFPLGKRQEIIWGLGYRYIQDDIANSDTLSLTPDKDEYKLISAFIQDEISFLDKTLRFIIGSKFEHNDFTGFEIQPNMRILWSPKDRYSVWAAVSRAVRTPNRAEDGLKIDNAVIPPGSLLPAWPGSGVVRILGNRDFDSEDLLAFECGFRSWFMDTLSIDVAAYYNIYDNLRDQAAEVPFVDTSFSPPVLILPYKNNNNMDGETYGVELAADYRPFEWWKLKAAYTFLQINLQSDDLLTLGMEQSVEGSSPHNQISLRSIMDLKKNFELDLWGRYVDSLTAQNVDSYITMDARLAWRPSKTLEVAVVGQNLFDESHPEFEPQFLQTIPTEVERGVYFKVTLSF
jgi:iron complex outermembrane recepter protein